MLKIYYNNIYLFIPLVKFNKILLQKQYYYFLILYNKKFIIIISYKNNKKILLQYNTVLYYNFFNKYLQKYHIKRIKPFLQKKKLILFKNSLFKITWFNYNLYINLLKINFFFLKKIKIKGKAFKIKKKSFFLINFKINKSHRTWFINFEFLILKKKKYRLYFIYNNYRELNRNTKLIHNKRGTHLFNKRGMKLMGRIILSKPGKKKEY